MTRSTSSAGTISGRSAGRPTTPRCPRPSIRSRGLLVDEADDVDAVLGVLEQLLRHELPDMAGADDQGVLDVRVRSPTERPRNGPAERDEDDGEHPEERELRKARVREMRDIGERKEEPRADRQHVEDAEELVDARVVGPLLVARVEVVDATEHDPEGERQGEQHDLDLRADPVVLRIDVLREEHLRQPERQQDARRVGDGECASDEPSPATNVSAALLDQFARTTVDEIEDQVLLEVVGSESGVCGSERLVDAHTLSSSRTASPRPLVEAASPRASRRRASLASSDSGAPYP